MEDASLDEFLEDDPEELVEGESESVDVERDDGSPEKDRGSPVGPEGGTRSDAEVEPATPTMVVSPDGERCESCDAPVRRRWRTEDGLRCVACKEW